jgi:putative DNA primase/helicase
MTEKIPHEVDEIIELIEKDIGKNAPQEKLDIFLKTLDIFGTIEREIILNKLKDATGYSKAVLLGRKAELGKSFNPRVVADEILEKFDIITTRDNETVYVYKNGVYEPDHTPIKEYIEYKLNEMADNKFVVEVLGHIKRMTYKKRKIFNMGPEIINVKNGLVDLTHNPIEFKKHSPKFYSLNQIPVKYDPKADCPNIKKFLSEIVSEDDIQLIREMIGYCLLKKYHIHKAFMLLGGGRNGKTTLLNLIIRFLGEENVATPSLQELLYNNFAKYELFGKLANIHDDIPAARLTQTGNFKMLTGMGLIRGEQKFKDSFVFYNYAKLIYSTNELPRTEDTTDAFFSRWTVIRFPNFFGKNAANPNLIEKITTPKELSGLLNWVLDALKELLKRGSFSESETTEDVRKEWILQSDSLRAFVLEEIEYDIQKMVTKNDFYEKYQEFCEEHNTTADEKALVGRRLPTIVPRVKVARLRVSGTPQRVWKGIKFKRFTDLNYKCSNLSLFNDNKVENGRSMPKNSDKKLLFNSNNVTEIQDVVNNYSNNKYKVKEYTLNNNISFDSIKDFRHVTTEEKLKKWKDNGGKPTDDATLYTAYGLTEPEINKLSREGIIFECKPNRWEVV